MKRTFNSTEEAMQFLRETRTDSVVCYVNGNRFRIRLDVDPKPLKICGPRQRKPKVSDVQGE